MTPVVEVTILCCEVTTLFLKTSAIHMGVIPFLFTFGAVVAIYTSASRHVLIILALLHNLRTFLLQTIRTGAW